MTPVSSVLIIDDESGVRESLAAIFREEGVGNVQAVPGAEEAFRVLEKESFDLIICDYLLRGMNGVAFMGKLRLKPDMTPILFISGVPESAELIKAAGLLRADFLAKPFSISELTSSVDRLLKSARS